jgi:DNA repair protein RecO (recombination protein O)
MQIKDMGIIIAKRLSGEKSAVVTAFTQNHGLYTFYAKSISGKHSVVYQLGNIVDIFISARLEEHMGTGRAELIFGSSHSMQNKTKLYALNSVLGMVLASFEERAPHPRFFAILSDYIKNSAAPFKFMEYARLESELLTEAGYGLDFRSCAVTESSEGLVYVSPKSGRAVSESAGEEYKDRLLKLPACALSGNEPKDLEELEQMAELLLYFFKRYVFKRGEPKERREFIGQVTLIARRALALEAAIHDVT